jgi:c(7)-type cytochrome triheme protein
MRKRSQSLITGRLPFRLVVVLAIFACFAAVAFTSRNAVAGSDATALTAPDPEPPPPQDFSRFLHGTATHTRLPCLVCHVRATNAAAPKMPGHIPCSSCHVEQFKDNTSPMCSICHTPTSVKPFPPLRSFGAKFNHAMHTRQTGCATCHKPASRGVALSIPDRLNAHATCFQCHTPRNEIGGRNIGSCGTCHVPGRLQRTPETAKAYGVNFSHSEHAAKGLSCAACHTVRAGSAVGRQVTKPLASMHFAPAGTASCAACHNNKRAFGGLDFDDCKKCHEGRTFRME